MNQDTTKIYEKTLNDLLEAQDKMMDLIIQSYLDPERDRYFLTKSQVIIKDTVDLFTKEITPTMRVNDEI